MNSREEILLAIEAAKQGIEKHRAAYPENLRKGLLYTARDNVDTVNALHEEIRMLTALLDPEPVVSLPEPVREIERKPEPMPVEDVEEVYEDSRPWWRKALRL